MVASSTLLETYGSGMNSKAGIYLRPFVFLLASSIGFDFTLRLKNSKEPPAYPRRLLRIQAMFRNEHANRFFNLNYMIALIEDSCKGSIFKLRDFLISSSIPVTNLCENQKIIYCFSSSIRR